MTILKVIAFQKTLKGRITSAFLAVLMFNLSSCTIYTAAETNMDEIRASNQVLQNMHVYKFYVFDAYGSYSLMNPVFNEDGSISGTLSLVNYQKPDSTWSAKERKAYWADHKYDIGIYTKSDLNYLQADANPANTLHTSTVTISADMIERMTITSIDAEGELGIIALAFLIAMGVILIIALLILILVAVTEAAGEGSEASSDGSTSNSDSGDSGSGGGSGSGSGS